MQEQSFTKPFYFFFLMLPAGISAGFVSVALPYLLTQHHFPVLETTAIVSVGVSANLLRFLWGPVADLTLTLRKWYWIGVLACTTTLLLLCFIPLIPKDAVLLTVVVFISQIAATFVMLPVGSFMANRMEAHKKGSASGWYQAGNLGGSGLGGGAGLWLAVHYSVLTAGIALCMICVLSALVVLLIKDVYRSQQETIVHAIQTMGKDIVGMLKVPLSLFVILLILLPIGTGAASNLFSAIAADWKTDADTVALVTGVLSGLISVMGCIIGGFVADRWGNWVAYLGSGTLCALVTIGMAALPYHPVVYIGGVLAYSFTLGLLNAAFSSVLLFAIGKQNAATKYSLLSSIGNLPVVYMTTFDGWTHDRHNSKYMLVAEGIVGIVFVVIVLIALKRMIAKKLISITVA